MNWTQAVGTIFTTEEHRAPTFLEWFRGKKVVPYTQEWVIKEAYVDRTRCTYAERTYTGDLADVKDITPPQTRPLGAEKPTPRPACQHLCRVPREPDFSFGDESDYISSCFHCGRKLRDEPNFR